MEKTLYNCYSNKCAGYCKKHSCGLTVHQLKGRECERKQCRHFKKYKNHPYYKQKERMKAKRKERKMRINELLGDR